MGLFDDEEEIEDFMDDNYVPQETNRYLDHIEDAIGLIAKIIPVSQKDDQTQEKFQKLDEMLNYKLLSAFHEIQLSKEAQMQVKLSMISDKLAEQKKFEILKNHPIVGFGGKFSAGKSKFINSILKVGDNGLLPEDQNPTTSIPTYIVHGGNEEIRAYTSENNKVILDTEALQALTHKFYEKYSMGFSSFINSLVILEPDMPYPNLAFLDTPGYSKADIVGSGRNQKDLTDENKAYVQLRSADYLIWLMDIENGVLSEPDIAFISKLELKTPILIVINKADKKTDEDIEQIVQLVEETAKDAGLQVFGVTAYSSRDQIEWRSAGLIEKFLRMADQKKNQDDIWQQVKEMKESILDELSQKESQYTEDKEKLREFIYEAENVMEIKTLVELYGDSIKQLKQLQRCKKEYRSNVKELENTLKLCYERT